MALVFFIWIRRPKFCSSGVKTEVPVGSFYGAAIKRRSQPCLYQRDGRSSAKHGGAAAAAAAARDWDCTATPSPETAPPARCWAASVSGNAAGGVWGGLAVAELGVAAAAAAAAAAAEGLCIRRLAATRPSARASASVHLVCRSAWVSLHGLA